MKVHESLAQGILDAGAPVVFGLVGDANLFIMDSYEKAGGRYVAFAHESGAVLAAVGYAQRSGGLGVATVTHGPALSNTVTALIEGVKSHSPVLVVAGDTAVEDIENVQNVPQREIVLSSGAGFVQVRSARTASVDLQRAVHQAVAERRPVVLNVPTNLQWLEAEEHTAVAAPVVQAPAADPDVLDDAAGILASARRPLVLAGRGAALSEGAREALVDLAAMLDAPLATTVRGKGMFSGEKSSIGIFGTFADEAGAAVIEQADTVIAFGASLNKWTTVEGSLLAGKRVIHVDDDPGAPGRWTSVSVSVVGDAARVARELKDMLSAADVPSTGFASAVAAREPAPERPRAARPEGTVDLAAAADVIDEAFPAPRTAVFDVGRFWYQTMPRIEVAEALAHVHTVSSGSIGLSVPCAIGAAFAAPQEPVLVVVGDGGFMLGGLAELNTAVRYGLNLTVVVMNDQAYGAEWVQLEDRDLAPQISSFAWPSFARVADALGATGHDVTSLESLRAAVERAGADASTHLIDVHVDPWGIPMGVH